MKNPNKQLVQRINEGDEAAFKELFYDYYHDLCSIAGQIVESSEQARDVVQEVFLKIWNVRAELHIKVSLDAYLYRSVRNQAINFVEKQKSQQRIKKNFAEQNVNIIKKYQIASQQGKHPELMEEIWRIVQTMPERRRTAITLSRQHGLTYKEISLVMGISKKTVEYHIGAALIDIRSSLEREKLNV